MQDYIDHSIKRLLHAVTSIQNDADCQAFFNDLCTIKELQDMSQRFDTAILLRQGKNYREISQEVGASTATISRVRRCLDYGSGGYETVITQMEKEGNTDADQ